MYDIEATEPKPGTVGGHLSHNNELICEAQSSLLQQGTVEAKGRQNQNTRRRYIGEEDCEGTLHGAGSWEG
jgi:hypothetical protein